MPVFSLEFKYVFKNIYFRNYTFISKISSGSFSFSTCSCFVNALFFFSTNSCYNVYLLDYITIV